MPTPPSQRAKRSATWLVIALATIATAVAMVALIVSLTRSTSQQATSTYTPAETAAAHQKLCDAYKLAARAVQIDTNGGNPAFAGIATVNGAVMLEEVVNRTPAIAPSDQVAAIALAEAYSNVAALSSSAGGEDPAWHSALNDANTKDAVMKKICGGS